MATRNQYWMPVSLSASVSAGALSLGLGVVTTEPVAGTSWLCEWYGTVLLKLTSSQGSSPFHACSMAARRR